MYLSSNTELYLQQTVNIDVFILKLRSILEVDFLNLPIHLSSNFKVYLKQTFNIDVFILKL